MTIDSLIENYEIYRTVATALNLCNIGINICILIVLLLQIKKEDKFIRRSFFIHISLILFELVVEILAWNLCFKTEYLTLYKIVTIIDFFILWLVPITMFNLVYSIIRYKVKLSKTFYYIYFGLFLFLGSLILIPPFRNLIIVFNDELGCYSTGILNPYYYLIESILVMVGLSIGFINSKKIGIKDTIVVSSYMITIMILTFVDNWLSSTISMVVLSFFLIILFGITYQNRLIMAREQEKERQIELADTKTKMLLNQIQPHFLYNTLTTLKFLCETSPSEASNLCDYFSSYLRSNIDAVSDDGLVPFEKEIDNITNYLKIEQMRFGKRVNYKFDIQVKDFLIPVLSIQTIIENAVKRGICEKISGGTINISTKDLGDFIEIKVSDDGVGFDINKFATDGRTHIGISNTKERIGMIGGTVEIYSVVGEGTTVIVKIPRGEE